MKKIYIIEPVAGKSDYFVMAEHGELLANGVARSKGQAIADLQIPSYKKYWTKRFGKYKVLFLGDDKTTHKDLFTKNVLWEERKKELDKLK